jgi:hypothetical protein
MNAAYYKVAYNAGFIAAVKICSEAFNMFLKEQEKKSEYKK